MWQPPTPKLQKIINEYEHHFLELLLRTHLIVKQEQAQSTKR